MFKPHSWKINFDSIFFNYYLYNNNICNKSYGTPMNLGPEYRFIGSSVDCDKMSSCLLTLNLRDIMHKCVKGKMHSIEVVKMKKKFCWLSCNLCMVTFVFKNA